MAQQVEPQGSDRHIKGFILNKLYLGGYLGKKHVDIEDIPKGYPPKHRGKFSSLIDELRRSGYIVVFPHGSRKRAFAVRQSDIIERGLEICNAYRKAVGLPPLNRRFKEVVKT
jgi:hypothetical protein